ncbi:MAG: diacylglycerol kinase family protein, partial [bacterium]
VTGVERVISHGGDGTLNEVANGLIGRGIPLMFLPGGTANAMAYELGIPLNPVMAARALLGSEPQPVYPGQVGNRIFMLMAGFGFDALIVYLVGKRLKSWLGAASYLLTGVRALAHHKPEIRVLTPDGEGLRGHWVVAARSRRYGGMLKVHPRAAMHNPDLGLVVVKKSMIVPFALTNLVFGTGFTGRGMVLQEHPRFRVTAEQPLYVHVDGDYIGMGTEFEVSICERALPFCFPGAE